MLFHKRFHDGLRAGSIDLTFRRWTTPRVKVGGRYRFGRSDILKVVAIDRVRLGDIETREARRAGFGSVEELRSALRSPSKPALTARTPVTRVRFRYEGEEESIPVARTPSEEEIARIAKRLAGMEKLSRRDPWIDLVLAWIEENPQRRAGDLADELGLEKQKLKSDVRRLKKLGLTRSFEVGYELTPLGRAVLRRRRS